MRSRFLLSALAGLTLCLVGVPAGALTLSAARTSATTDDDTLPNADASFAHSAVGPTSATIGDVVSGSATVQGRFAGQASSCCSDGVTQSADYTITFTVTSADPTVVYNIAFAPVFHGRLQLTNSTGDSASFGNLTGRVNGVVTSALAMSGASITTAATITNVDDSAAHTITGLTGTQSFAIRYTFSAAVDTNAILFNDASALYGLDALAGTNNNYATAAARDADGLFVPATVTITAVPEPGTMLLLGAGLCGLALVGRQRS